MRVAFSSELAANPNKRTEDTHEYGPMAKAVAEAGGVFVALLNEGRAPPYPDVVLVGRGATLGAAGSDAVSPDTARILHMPHY